VYINGHTEKLEEGSLEQKSAILLPSYAARKVAEMEEEDKEDKAVKGDGKRRRMKGIAQEVGERKRR
jgi:hypothetical protein